MAFAKRIVLFLLTNFLVMATISIALNLLGIRGYITQAGIDYNSLMAFCLVWGMGGAFISLLMSKMTAKWFMGVKVIDPNTPNAELQELVQTVHRLAQDAGISRMPEIGIYESPELNAFATGPTKNRSLVAVSTGLLQRMNRAELEGVLGHEVSHVANGDMVTMALVQGVVNAFVMFLARALAFAIAQAMRGRDDRDGNINFFAYRMISFVLEIVFMIFGTMVVAWFSRYREFRADAGGAKLAGQGAMIQALEKLRRTYEIVDPNEGPATVQALKISGHRRGLLGLFATHPPLEDRILRLQKMA